MKTATPEHDLGQTLRLWREEADMRIEDVAVLVSQRLPRPMRISREMVRRYEAGDVPLRGMNPLVVGEMTALTGHRPADLPAAVKADIERLSEVVLAWSRWTATQPA